MLEVGKRHVSARTGGWVEVVDRAPGRLTAQRLLKPNTGKADPHYHLDFTQTWEGVEGEATVEVDGKQRALSAGDRVVIEPGQPHRDPFNQTGADALVRGTFEPVPEFIEAYAEVWAHHLEQGTVNEQDEMSLLQILLTAKATNGKSYAAGPPRFIQQAMLPLVAAIARARGLRARYD